MECCFRLSATDATSFITSCISRDSEMPLCYCHLMNNAGYITYFKTGLEMPPNCPFRWADLGSNLTHGSLGLHKSTHLDQFSHFSKAHSCDEQTHRQTTLHAATDCSLYFTQRCSSLLIPVVSAHLPLLTSYTYAPSVQLPQPLGTSFRNQAVHLIHISLSSGSWKHAFSKQLSVPSS